MILPSLQGDGSFCHSSVGADRGHGLQVRKKGLHCALPSKHVGFLCVPVLLSPAGPTAGTLRGLGECCVWGWFTSQLKNLQLTKPTSFIMGCEQTCLTCVPERGTTGQ